MFDYKKRLNTIKAELIDIDAKLSPIITDETTDEVHKALALGICRISRILVRVINSLPG